MYCLRGSAKIFISTIMKDLLPDLVGSQATVNNPPPPKNSSLFFSSKVNNVQDHSDGMKAFF